MDVFSIKKPENPLPLVLDSPHSGHVYPEDFEYACDFEALQRAEDKYVDDLFASAPDHGATLLLAHFPRSYIDVNRAECDVDPELLGEAWPFEPLNPTARSDAGIGLVRRLVKPGVTVYDRKLAVKDVVHRIEKYYSPYHEALEQLIQEAHYNFGQVWHINCHSMPSSSAKPKQPIGLIGNKPAASDFCLGDRDGTSCAIEFTHALRDFLKDKGYRVTINDPFKGVELVARHSNPTRGFHSLQVEINKSLYMDEETNEKNKNYDALKADIDAMTAFCAGFVNSRLVDLAAD